ncbi:JAB domain-containing protein [Sphingomonas sp. CCH21-G11]|uniref:JAB domain-containing protein n=1 Tax=Sphingomonas sp. CCH21-G11 TaxID=1768749 RepID=UPI0018D22A3D|nr:JAB domain-containing protein [Sphingomonas sp. CCH21-G11]
MDEVDADADRCALRSGGHDHASTQAPGDPSKRLLGRLGARPFFRVRSKATSRALISAMAGPLERLRVILLDEKDGYIHDEEIAMGDANSLSADFRSVFKIAFNYGASGIALVHNHPSGNCEPSSKDIEATRRINSLAHILGFRLVDHIIVGGDAAHSIKTGARLK